MPTTPNTLRELLVRTFLVEEEKMVLRYKRFANDLDFSCVRPRDLVGFTFMIKSDGPPFGLKSGDPTIYVRATSVVHNLNVGVTLERGVERYVVRAYRQTPLVLHDDDRFVVNRTTSGIPVSVDKDQLQHPLLPLMVDMVNALTSNWSRAQSLATALEVRQRSFLQDIDKDLRKTYGLPTL